MSDSERVKLIRTIITNAWDAVPTHEECGYWKGVLQGIETVLEVAEDG